MHKKILVVDDEKDVLDMLGARLEAAGYNVLKASGGVEGLAIAKEECPALIILDVLMPDMSGNEVAEKLSADPVTKHIPVIFLTATLSREQEKACRSVGKTFFLSKPYEPEELISIVSRLVGLG